MTNFDNETIKRLITLLRDVAKDETIRHIHKLKIETYRDMNVVSVNNIQESHPFSFEYNKTTISSSFSISKTVSATVVDMVTGETLTDIPNCTGEELKKGQIVRVYTSSDLFPGTNRQSYIGATNIQGVL